jgi:hypothetical protein
LMALQRCTRAALPRFMQTHAQQPQRRPTQLELSTPAA